MMQDIVTFSGHSIDLADAPYSDRMNELLSASQLGRRVLFAAAAGGAAPAASAPAAPGKTVSTVHVNVPKPAIAKVPKAPKVPKVKVPKPPKVKAPKKPKTPPAPVAPTPAPVQSGGPPPAVKSFLGFLGGNANGGYNINPLSLPGFSGPDGGTNYAMSGLGNIIPGLGMTKFQAIAAYANSAQNTGPYKFGPGTAATGWNYANQVSPALSQLGINMNDLIWYGNNAF
jgi:hypothetical protein